MAICKVLNKSPDYQDLDLIRKYCITKSPGFAGVALLPQYYIVDSNDAKFGKQIAFTDGLGIYVCKKFFKESPKAQAFILIHEVMHVALRHPQRGLALRKNRLAAGLPWSSEVFNWAVDAIVNFGLKKINSWVQEPSIPLITFENLLKPEVLQATPAHRWSAEKLFTYLMDEVISPAIASGASKEVSDCGKDNLPKNYDKFLDIEQPLDSNTVQEDTTAESRNWEGRLKRAAAGDRAGGIMREILFDIPVATTPWRHILRRFVSEAVMPQTQVRPSKPSKHNIAYSAFYANTANSNLVPFFPAYQPKPGIRKLVIVVDTSGSIDDAMCEYFASEIQSIRSKLGCDLTIITCDAEVHQTINVSAYDDLKKVIKANQGFKGNGGTDFRPGVAAAEKCKGAAAIIYLTDMMGPYPSKCSLPLLWASILSDYTKPPVGRVLVLKDN